MKGRKVSKNLVALDSTIDPRFPSTVHTCIVPSFQKSGCWSQVRYGLFDPNYHHMKCMQFQSMNFNGSFISDPYDDDANDSSFTMPYVFFTLLASLSKSARLLQPLWPVPGVNTQMFSCQRLDREGWCQEEER